VVNTTNWIIGRDRDIAGRYFNGKIGDVAIINRAFSDGDIYDLYLTDQTTADARHGFFARSGRVGAAETASDLTEASGIFAMSGVGAGIGGAADDFEFAARPQTGDIALTARLEAMKLSAAGSGAGLMFRDSLASNAPCVLLYTETNGNLSLRTRQTTGGIVTNNYTRTNVAPAGAWLRLIRNGTNFTAAYSSNGITFTTLDKAVVTLAASAQLGIVMSPNSVGISGTAQFSHVDFSVLALVADADGDGLTDAWELQNFGSLNVTAGTGDADNDGASDAAEWVAGTNPNSANSIFKLAAQPSITPGSVDIQWPGATGRTYNLQGKSDLTAAWTMIESNITAVLPTTSRTLSATNVASYYRVEVIYSGP
jgi:hypothetical protein